MASGRNQHATLKASPSVTRENLHLRNKQGARVRPPGGVASCLQNPSRLVMVPYMDAVAVTEFPFVESLPKRDKGRVQTAWDHFRELSEISKSKGMIMPQSFAAYVLGVSRSRVSQLIDAGRLRAVDVRGERWVTEDSIVEWARAEHRVGRPPNIPKTVGECLTVARQAAKGDNPERK